MILPARESNAERYDMDAESAQKLTLRRIIVAFVPLVALIGMIVVGVTVFGRDVGDGPSQISLVFATAFAALLANVAGGVPWSVLEQGITSSISKAGVSIMIPMLTSSLNDWPSSRSSFLTRSHIFLASRTSQTLVTIGNMMLSLPKADAL